MTNPLNRRQFIQLGGGAVVVAGLGACDRDGVGHNAAGTLPTTSAPNVTAPVVTTATTTAAPSTTIATTGGTSFDGRRLVVVQLNGGNDLLNSLPPTDSRYRDLRPTIAIPEADIVTLSGLDDAGLHPSLSGLARFWDVGQLALVRGIGFEVPNRSHFVSMDRWWRADQLSEAGWLGRVLDGLPAEPSPLFATALGGGAPLLNGRGVQPTVITSPGSFRWVGFDPRWLSAMGGGGADLAGMARHAFQRTVQAVTDFAEITGGSATSEDLPTREGGATLAEGLSVAAQLLAADAGTQMVVVSAGGFDTHANQLTEQSSLLKDLATGIDAFFEAIEAAGLGDDVLLVVTSEFGRRAAENGSGGCDHGAGGLSLSVGRGVRGGVFGEVDFADLLDGDIRPNVAPQALFTNCLDWLGVDADQILGSRDDSLALLH
ncbi:MAG: DUF1501 domain-containing protein [Ilumatobacteraceae bacterium]|nr:DUF1501 domain-containing protein [Ilumatobacteraceae bacterium]